MTSLQGTFHSHSRLLTRYELDYRCRKSFDKFNEEIVWNREKSSKNIVFRVFHWNLKHCSFPLTCFPIKSSWVGLRAFYVCTKHLFVLLRTKQATKKKKYTIRQFCIRKRSNEVGSSFSSFSCFCSHKGLESTFGKEMRRYELQSATASGASSVPSVALVPAGATLHLKVKAVV